MTTMPTVPPDPDKPADRARAYRLRRDAKHKVLPPTDRLWLDEYSQTQKKKGPPSSADVGASRSGRKLTIDLEEHAEAVGTGSAAAAAAAAALAAREEGRRLDSLTVEAVGALKTACNVYKDICQSMRERTEILEETHVALLESVRLHYVRSAEAEAELVTANAAHAAAADKPESVEDEIMKAILPKLAAQLIEAGFMPPPPASNGKTGA